MPCHRTALSVSKKRADTRLFSCVVSALSFVRPARKARLYPVMVHP